MGLLPLVNTGGGGSEDVHPEADHRGRHPESRARALPGVLNRASGSEVIFLVWSDSWRQEKIAESVYKSIFYKKIGKTNTY